MRTGVTAVLPHGGNLFQEKVPGAVFVGNAFGKLAGSTQVDELGTIETPIVLTNTLERGRRPWRASAGVDARAAGQRRRPVGQRAGRRNQRRRPERHPRPARHAATHVLAAIAAAREGPVDEGSVGAGTGTQCFGWKGGIGTSSRRPRRRVALRARRARADELRRRAHDRRRARRQAAGPPCVRAAGAAAGRRGRGRRLLHDRRRDRRAARRPRPEAAGRARRLRPRAHGVVVQPRQRRLRHRVLDRAGPADAHGRADARGAGRSCRPTACRRCSRRRSRRPRKRSTTRSSARRR